MSSSSAPATPSSQEDPLRQTAAYWDENAEKYFGEESTVNRAEWQGHPACWDRRTRSLGGLADHEWLSRKFHRPLRLGLGAGCGRADFELKLLAKGAIEHFDLYDVSASALEVALNEAETRGLSDHITVHQGDMFEAVGEYDLITFVGSLHHAQKVGDAVQFAHELLKPGGYLYCDEYVGPRRFGYPAEHSDLVKSLYRSLAPELRCQWPELPQPRPEEVAAADPTEAVESDEILLHLQAQFAQIEIIPQYGALPFILWWGLDHDALWDTQQGREFVDTLLELDDALGISGRLPPYFILALAQRAD